MYLYDKHDFSVRACVYELLKGLAPLQERRPVFLEIGSGFHTRYTGDLLYGLFLAAIKGMDPRNVEMHLVDPALYGYYSQIAVHAITSAFGAVDFRTHAEMWTPSFAEGFRSGGGNTRFNAAFALETTTLMPPDVFETLHADLYDLLAPGGYFLDVSEVGDKATSNVYQGLTIWSRSGDERKRVAAEAGFQLVGEHEELAHATSVPDDQKMVGMLFRKPE